MTDSQEHSAINPSDLPLVTLDNNALIAVREQEPAAEAVNELLDMNRASRIVINITLSTGLEAAPGGRHRDWQEYIPWLESLGIAKPNIFTGPRTIYFSSPSMPGMTIVDGALETQFNMQLHDILFPNIPFLWYDFRDRECARAGLPTSAMRDYDLAQGGFYIPPTPQHPRQRPTPHYDALSPEEQARVSELHRKLKRTWHNVKNDALGLYNHLTVAVHTAHPEWSVFVTNDRNFLKLPKLDEMRALGFKGEILRPGEAITFLRRVANRSL